MDIAYYDQRMTGSRAEELRSEVIDSVRRLLQSTIYSELCVCMGKTYLKALDGYRSLVAQQTRVVEVSGPIGRQLAGLRDWLHGAPPRVRYPSRLREPGGLRSWRGIQVALAPADVMKAAREALAVGRGGTDNYHAWYVIVDRRRVAPKWLISQALGIPTSAFTTGEACRLLAQLGIKVRRV
jgi:hypothetical protein